MKMVMIVVSRVMIMMAKVVMIKMAITKVLMMMMMTAMTKMMVSMVTVMPPFKVPFIATRLRKCTVQVNRSDTYLSRVSSGSEQMTTMQRKGEQLI